MNSPSTSPLTVVLNISHACVCVRILAVVTIRGRRLFHLELPIVRLLFKGSVYLKKYGSRICESSCKL